jgi:hypothetical protein
MSGGTYFPDRTSHPSGDIPAPYSAGPEFKFRPRDWLSWLRFFVVFLSPSRQMYQYDSMIVSVSSITPRPFPSKSFPIVIR